MSEFKELYKTLSNSELLKIISESEKYKPKAVETAHLEIESRNLSEKDIIKAQSLLQLKKEQKQAEGKKRKQKEDKLKKGVLSFLEVVSPIQNGIQTPEKIIRLITLIFGSISVYKIYKEFHFFRHMFIDGIDKWDWSTIEYVLSFILLPVAIILFWKRKKTGWFLMAVFLTYSAIMMIGLFLMNLNRRPTGFSVIDEMFPVIPSQTYILLFIFYSATLWLIYKTSVRSVFKITEKPALYIISITAILNLIYIYIIID